MTRLNSLKDSLDTPSERANDAHQAFKSVDCWIFDLDNTLYPAQFGLFDQIDKRMTEFIARELGLDADSANTLRKDYWRAHGTTLNGLMREHGAAPEPFLEYVHDIDLEIVPPAPALCAAIDALPGRKVVFTNGSRRHAERVVARLGAEGCFSALYGIEDAGLSPKPQREAYDRIIALSGLEPTRAAMVEDTARNLIEPHRMGMKTVWTPTDCDLANDGAEGEHVHFVAPDLTAFLGMLCAPPRQP